MWISKENYNEQQAIIRKLEEECERLSRMISTEVKDCKVGPWCDHCAHKGIDVSQIKKWDDFGHPYVAVEAGRVIYCRKHLHEVCPEFEAQ